MKIIKVEYESKIQLDTLNALVQSFEDQSLNMDKFMNWIMKTYDVGNSIYLRLLKDITTRVFK